MLENLNKVATKYVHEDQTILLLRLSLSLTFIWFGALKLFGVSPVSELIKSAMPAGVGSNELFFLVLSIMEIVIGVGLLIKPLVKLFSVILIGHLIVATLSVLVTQGFSPAFPILTFPGEFVAKNLVLITAALVLIAKRKTV